MGWQRVEHDRATEPPPLPDEQPCDLKWAKHLSYPTSSHFLFLLLLLSHFSPVQLLATPWTAAYQTPPSMGFSRQEYWSGVPLPSPILFLQKRINIFRVTTMRSNLPPERIKGQKEKIQLKQILTGASLKIGSTI